MSRKDFDGNNALESAVYEPRASLECVETIATL